MDALKIITTRRALEYEGDYKKHGLLYCGKCDTPKEARAMLFDKEIICGIMCQCEEKKHNLLKEKLKNMEARERIEDLKKQGITDAEYSACTFESDDKQDLSTTTKCLKYVDKFDDMKRENIGLLFFGSVGTGKSFFACAIANALIDKGIPVLVTNIPRLINKLMDFNTDKNEFIDSLSKYDLLIFDDMGTERHTEVADEIVTSIIDARYRSGKPMLITSNLTPQELLATTDKKKQRIYDRMIQNCIPIKLDGTSRRRTIAKDKREKYLKLLEN